MNDTDVNNDGRTDAQDIAYVRSKFGTADAAADVDRSGGKVDAIDIAIARAAFWASVQPSWDLDTEELLFFSAINVYRAEHSLGALALSKTLSQAAQWKAEYEAPRWAANLGIAHDDAEPFRRWIDRIAAFYPFVRQAYVGENIAGGLASAQAALAGWKASPGHNDNMLHGLYTAIGIGRADSAGNGNFVWVTDFASISDGWPS